MTGATPVFALATYQTDDVMVKQSQLEGAVESLSRHGHLVLQVGSKGRRRR